MAKRPERTARTEADLRQAFWKLYAEKPIEKVTVGEVCALAGYNRGTFYLHFHDVYDLLDAIEDDVLAGMTECVAGCMRRLERNPGKLGCLAACTDVVRYYERNRDYVTVLLGERGDASFTHRLKENLKPLWRDYVIGTDEERSDEETDLVLEYALSGTLFMISRWLASPGGVSARRLAHLVYDFSIKDVRARSSS